MALGALSFRRLARSRQTLVCLVLLALAAAVVATLSRATEPTFDELRDRIIVPLYASFLLPIFCLAFATASISSEREEQTLVYVLVSPLPRTLIYLVKWCAALAATLPWTLGSLALLALLAGPAGPELLARHWTVFLWATLAYASLFHLLGAVLLRAALVGLAYAFFVEVVLGNMPGIVQRLAVSFYVRSSLWADVPGDSPLFQGVSAPAATTALLLIAFGSLALGAAVFSRREY